MLKKLTCFPVIAALAMSCGGTTTGGNTTPDNPEDATPAVTTQDVVLDKFAEVPLAGMRFSPQALGLPGMWKITPPKRATVKKYRKLAKKKNASAATIQVFAGLLWNESNKKYDSSLQKEADAAVATDDKKRGKLQLESEKLKAEMVPLRTEAVEALRAHNLAKAGTAEEITLQMLSVGEMTLGDDAAATKVYEELVTRFPESAHIDNYKTWLTYLYLKADRNADAAKIIEGWNRESIKPSLGFMADYVVAWTSFRAGKLGDARDAINSAAMGWKGNGRDAVNHELILINARSGSPVMEVDMTLQAIYGDSVGPRYRALYTLKQGYFAAGNYAEAVATLELMASGKVIPEVPPNDLVAFPYERSAIELRLNQPAKTAESIISAYKLLTPCAEKCTQFADPVTNAIHQYATLFHTIYATSMDNNYYEPAKKLYDFYLNDVPKRDNTDTILGYASRLKDTKENANPAQGKHDAEAIDKLLGLRKEVPQGCYEQVLQGEPGLTGKLKLTMNLKEDGNIESASSDPAAGEAGLAAVASCLIEKVKTWKMPTRSIPGTTAIVWSFAFAPTAP